MTDTLADAPGRDDESPKLPPLPKRVGDEPDALEAAADPLAVVDELLERAGHLLATLHTDVAGLQRDQAEEQVRIEERWRAQQTAVDEATVRLADLYREARDLATKKGKPEVLEAALARPATLGADDRERADGFDRLVGRLTEELRLARGITGAIRLPDIGALLNSAAARLDLMEQEAERTRQRLLSETEDELVAEGTEARASFEIGTMVLQRDLEVLDRALPLGGASWSDPRWTLPELPELPQTWIRLGGLVHDELPETTVPLLGSLRDGLGLFVETGGRRGEAVAGVLGILTRVLAAVPPGAVRLSLVDPKGLGDSFAPLLALADFDPGLVPGGVRVSEEEIEACLEQLTHHVEHVIATHLQGRYASITDAHLDLGEVVEPYRLLVLADYPTGLTERSLELLGPLTENGPRCGVHTIVLRDPAAPRSRARGAPAMHGLRACRHTPEGFVVETARAGAWRLCFEPCPPADAALPGAGAVSRVVTGVGEQARRRARTPLGHQQVFALVDEARQRGVRDDLPLLDHAVDPSDPTTWWSGDAGPGVAIPVGRAAGRQPATVWLDSRSSPGALVVGGAGPALGHALDTLLTGAVMLYAPTELELALVDLTGTLEVGAYGRARLPHARVVASEAEPELGLAVLELLEAELDLRTTLLRAAGLERGDLQDFRAATGGPLSRLVLVLAGGSALVGGNDRTARTARETLDRLVVEGPALGLHLLALERVADSLDPIAWVPDALGASLVLDDAAAVVMGGADGDLADVARSMGAGEALQLRSGRTDPVRLRTSHVDPRERALSMRDAESLATARAFARRPTVVSSTAPGDLERAPLGQLLGPGAARRADRLKPRLWLGEPVAIGDPVEVLLRREDAANVLAVTGDDQQGQGLLAAALVSAALVHGRALEVRAVDCMPLEAGFGEVLAALGALTQVQVARQRDLVPALEAAGRELARRRQGGLHTEAPVLVVINGLDAARGLDATGGEATALLENLVAAGPALGIHTVVWAGSAEAVDAHLSPAAQRRFALRIVGPMDEADALALVDSHAAAGLAPTQALLYDEALGRVTRFRPFQVPSATWLRGLDPGPG